MTGRDLGPYQEGLSGEREVLFPADSTFEVKAFALRDGAFFVIIQQVLAVPESATVRDPWDGSQVPTRSLRGSLPATPTGQELFDSRLAAVPANLRIVRAQRQREAEAGAPTLTSAFSAA